MNEMRLRIAICSSNYIFAESLKKLLENESDIHIIGIYSTEQQQLSDIENILKRNPDIILADFRSDSNILTSLPDDYFSDNRQKILLIGDKSLRFIVDRNLRKLISRGVVGILPPSADSDILKKAIKAVSEGELWLDRSTIIKMFRSMKRHERNTVLARREQEIVHCICQGYRNKEISQMLNISEQTVKSHCNRIYKKLGVSDRLQLVVYAKKILPQFTNS